jgi:peptide-methionine (S)-S-oxide reductase
MNVFTRRALLALSSATSAFAWTTSRPGAAISTSHGFLGRSVLPSSLKNSVMPRSITGTTPTMLFGNLFGGGAYETKIDYTVLPHPGPELAEFAQQGVAPEASARDPHLRLATFAGGCFWGLELAFQRVPGVEYTAVGYTQGPEQAPTYGQVCSGRTGHTEAVTVYYDPNQATYEQLLDAFFGRVNPLTVNGQGNDFGTQYRTGVYYHSKEQQEIAEARFAKEQEKYGARKIATECKKAQPFWPAEKYHQQYLEKGGRSGSPQSAEKGATETIRCYG